MPSAATIILTLKILVCAVTLLYAGAIVAIATNRRTLHGRLNTAFFILTLTTVIGFELLLRFGLDASATFSPEARQALRIHLGFAVPAALLLPVMFVLGIRRRRRLHAAVGVVFTLLWLGTFVTGVFFLPHSG